MWSWLLVKVGTCGRVGVGSVQESLAQMLQSQEEHVGYVDSQENFVILPRSLECWSVRVALFRSGW